MSGLKIAITGSSGMVGSHLVDFFEKKGISLSRLARYPEGQPLPSAGAAPRRPTVLSRNERIIFWDPEKGIIEKEKLEGHEALIHLAGATIASHRWSLAYKRLILESRVKSTEFLCHALARLKHPPQVVLSASAVGYYGNRPATETLDESSGKGDGFLAEVCDQWEKATAAATASGIRVIRMRFGMILSRSGGALAKMVPIFQWGLGGPLGSGRQEMSWIALDEIPHVILHLINHKDISGPVNVVSPGSVSNRAFTKLLGQTLKRPAVFPVPAFAVRLMFGQMGEELLLSGAKVRPGVLERTHYRFLYPDLKSTLEFYCQRSP